VNKNTIAINFGNTQATAATINCFGILYLNFSANTSLHLVYSANKLRKKMRHSWYARTQSMLENLKERRATARRP
jgi:hypothetical protein